MSSSSQHLGPPTGLPMCCPPDPKEPFSSNLAPQPHGSRRRHPPQASPEDSSRHPVRRLSGGRQRYGPRTYARFRSRRIGRAPFKMIGFRSGRSFQASRAPSIFRARYLTFLRISNEDYSISMPNAIAQSRKDERIRLVYPRKMSESHHPLSSSPVPRARSGFRGPCCRSIRSDAR